jgi:hypothetical protein
VDADISIEIMNTKLFVDTAGVAAIGDQADMLLADIGTDREWIAVGHADEDGFAEVALLCHPMSAERFARAINEHDLLCAVQSAADGLQETVQWLLCGNRPTASVSNEYGNQAERLREALTALREFRAQPRHR